MMIGCLVLHQQFASNDIDFDITLQEYDPYMASSMIVQMVLVCCIKGHMS